MRRFDACVAAAWMGAMDIEVLVLRNRRGPLALNLLAVVALALPAVWRRRAPVRFVLAVLLAATAYIALLSGDRTNVAPLFVLTVLPYTVSAYAERTVAIAGLALMVAWASTVNAFGTPTIGSDLGTIVNVAVPWAFGRVLHARRRLDTELERRVERIEAERESRARLAVADERTRIARELHTVVAAGVSAMVVQAQAAQLLLDADPERADMAMAAVEETGRQALTEMRRLLGVLRHSGEAPVLAPQPGVGQVHALVEAARGPRRRIELSVVGEPGPLSASVDLGIYRILEDALKAEGLLVVALRFGLSEVELEVSGTDAPPTLAQRERVAAGDGELESEPGRLLVRLPRTFDRAFA